MQSFAPGLFYFFNQDAKMIPHCERHAKIGSLHVSHRENSVELFLAGQGVVRLYLQNTSTLLFIAQNVRHVYGVCNSDSGKLQMQQIQTFS